MNIRKWKLLMVYNRMIINEKERIPEKFLDMLKTIRASKFYSEKNY